MSVVAAKTYTVALVGNPNTGKSTLFNALAGVRQRVGNYPGVTVEKKLGRAEFAGRKFELIDLPGTYSLAPRSPDEMVTVDVLLGRQSEVPAVDAVLCIVDANNLERNLYLVSQVLELGLPTVVALNMVDVAEQHGLKLDVERLSRQLGVPVVPLQAHRRVGLDSLQTVLAQAVESSVAPRENPFPVPFRQEVDALNGQLAAAGERWPRFLVERLLLDTSGYIASGLALPSEAAIPAAVLAARERLAQAGLPVPAVEAVSRYGWVAKVVAGVVERSAATPRVTGTDRIDGVLCHKFLGVAIFIVVMILMFQAVFTGAAPLMAGIDAGVEWLADAVKERMAIGPLRSMIVEGIIGGVGSVIVFLPQIAILFLFIAILEDCGYMARAAYLMDRVMAPVGLSGKSFIPLLSSFACAIPGVMAARVIENRRDRLTTILVAPLMSCSARLPVYTILIAAFIPDIRYFELSLGSLSLSLGLRGLTMFAMYLLGVVVAAGVAWLLKRTLLAGETPPFVMELPVYRWPAPRTIFYRIIDRCWGFLRRAGTLILAVSIIIWAMLYYPRRAAVERVYVHQRQALATQLAETPAADADRSQREQRLAELDGRFEGQMSDPDQLAQMQRESILGHAGRTIEPLVRPLGWDWRIGSAAIASFPAREVVVATLGVIFKQGEPDLDDETSQQALQQALIDARWDGTDQPLFTLPTALSLMVFFALCAQCAATLAVIRRETDGWHWPAFTFTYMTTLAYVAALITYQLGSRWM